MERDGRNEDEGSCKTAGGNSSGRIASNYLSIFSSTGYGYKPRASPPNEGGVSNEEGAPNEFANMGEVLNPGEAPSTLGSRRYRLPPDEDTSASYPLDRRKVLYCPRNGSVSSEGGGSTSLLSACLVFLFLIRNPDLDIFESMGMRQG